MIQRTKWIVLASVTSFLLMSSCVPVEKVTCDLTLESKQPSQSDSLEIAIHVDGSGSMLGYVTNNTSRYIQTLKLLDQTFSLSSSRPNQTVKYYRSGTDSPEITRQDFRKAQEAEFYDGSNPDKFPGVSSGLDAAITPPENGDKLFVMVTDLYQNDNDVTLLNKKIKETYLNQQRKGYAVGIVAIRSEFNGTIYYEVGNTLETFSYTTEGKKPEQFRPFYIMFLGPYADISYYLAQLKAKGGQLLEDSKFLIFSPDHIASDLSYLSDPQKPLPQELKQPSSLNNGKVAVEVDNTQKFQLLEIDKNPAEELKINYSVDFNPISYTLPLDPNSINHNLKTEAFDIWDKQFKEPSNNSPTGKALQLSEWQQADNKLSFVTTLRPNFLPEPGIYRFIVDVEAKGLQEPAWWKEWTVNASENSEDKGSKTHNLSDFLRGLKNMTTELMEKKPPVIGRFCYAIQKN